MRALDGVTRDSLLTRPGPRSNPLLWVALAVLRDRVVLNFQAEAEGVGVEKLISLEEK